MAKNLLPAFMEAANILKVKGLIEEEANLEEFQTKHAETKSEDSSDNSDMAETKPENSDDCLVSKFDVLEDEIDAVMKDVKTFDEEEKEEEDSTLNKEDQDKVDEEDVVKLIETVVEECSKESETKGRSFSCDLCSFVTAAKKRNSRVFAMKRHMIKAHGEKGIWEKSLKVEEKDVLEEEEKLEAENELGFEPSHDENMDLSEEIDDSKADLEENEIIPAENVDEENQTASNQEESQMEDEIIKEEEFGGKLEEEKAPTLPCNFCSFVSSARRGHNRNTALKRHMKVFHAEHLAEPVPDSSAESNGNEFVALASSVEEEASMDATTEGEEEVSNEEIEDDSILTKIEDLNHLIEEGREEEEEVENVEPGMEESGDLVIYEEPSLERLHCQQCNFVTSAKNKKDRASGLKRHKRSHHAETFVTDEAATEQTTLEMEDVNHIQDDDEKDVTVEDEIKEGVSDDLTQILGPSFSENSTLPEDEEKSGASCALCGFASSATRKSDFVSSMKRHMIRKHGGQVQKYKEENAKIKVEQTTTIMETNAEVEEEGVSMEEVDNMEEKSVEEQLEIEKDDLETSSGEDIVDTSNENLKPSSDDESPSASMACVTCGFASKSVSKANQVLVFSSDLIFLKKFHI